MNRVQASQLVPSIHGAGAADAFTARAAKGQRWIHLVLDPDQRIENHRPAIVNVDAERIETGIAAGIRIVAIDLERLHPLRAGGDRPHSPFLDA
jgi:hypothetical protein